MSRLSASKPTMIFILRDSETPGLLVLVRGF
jgi:hypothetical protein